MKRQISKLAVLSLVMLSMNSQRESQENFFNRLIDNSLILHQDGLSKGAKAVQDFVSGFGEAHGRVNSYESKFSIEVNSILDYEIGEIRTNSKSFAVLFIKRKDANPGIEFLVIHEMLDPESQPAALDQARNTWMELCNAHQADELVKRIYTEDAYYYNRGRLLQGTASIAGEYSYMNNPAYSLKLTPKHIAFVTPGIAYEIGQCSGSYPLPYMLLWQKQTDESWKVLMDSNY